MCPSFPKIGIYLLDKFTDVELLGQKLCTLVILINILKLPLEKVVTIYVLISDWECPVPHILTSTVSSHTLWSSSILEVKHGFSVILFCISHIIRKVEHLGIQPYWSCAYYQVISLAHFYYVLGFLLLVCSDSLYTIEINPLPAISCKYVPSLSIVFSLKLW